MKKIFLLMIIMVLVSSFQAFSEVKEKTITVNGHGELNIDPNVAYVTFGVEVIGKNAKEAQKKNAEKMEKLVDVLVKKGIEEEKIKTQYFNLNPVKKYYSGNEKIVGYKCDNQIIIIINNLDSVGKIIDIGIASGANKVNRIVFTVKDGSKYENMAIEKAIENAREKARAIEKASRVQIKKIHSIIEKGARVRPVNMGRGSVAYAAKSSPETKIYSGKIKVVADVTMRFEY